jgi:hypothetical protein
MHFLCQTNVQQIQRAFTAKPLIVPSSRHGFAANGPAKRKSDEKRLAPNQCIHFLH